MNTEVPKFTNATEAIVAWEKDLKLADQKRMEKVFQVGEYSPYAKEPRPIQWDAFREACSEWVNHPGAFIKNLGEHVRKIDFEFRGGRDYGDASERLERIGEYAKMIVIFTAFDALTSKPFDELFHLHKEEPGAKLTPDQLEYNARWGAVKKILEVMNDKYATALGNMYVEKQTGKRGYIHEVADKGGDTLNVGYKEPLEDFVNGATLESYLRIVAQIPVVGALFEQGVTRLAGWQEKSALHTATGKMLYMALGVYIANSRAAAKGRKLSASDLGAATLRAAF